MKYLAILTLVLSIAFFTDCDKENNDKDVDTTTLHAAIVAYINTNYAGYSIDEAQKDTLCNGTAGIEVELEKRNADEITLFFSNENVFILKEEEIKYSALPTGVQAFYATNYPNYKLPKNADKITLANGTVQYEVDLKEKTTHVEKEVITNLDGTSKICER